VHGDGRVAGRVEPAAGEPAAGHHAAIRQGRVQFIVRLLCFPTIFLPTLCVSPRMYTSCSFTLFGFHWISLVPTVSCRFVNSFVLFVYIEMPLGWKYIQSLNRVCSVWYYIESGYVYQ
jgi:hypothetical protein